jgi:glycine cleavage system H protein
MDECHLPGDRLYNVERDVWFKELAPNVYRVGVTLPLCFIAGLFKLVKPRPENSLVARGAPIALLVSNRYEGALTAPAQLLILKNNPRAASSPQLVCEDPYGEGWISDVNLEIAAEKAELVSAEDARALYAEKNRRNGIVCLKAVPRYSRRIFGETCTTILSEIGDFMDEHVGVGELLHVVTKDPATELDMLDWARNMGHDVVDIKRVGEIIHVLFRKGATKPSTTRTARM